MSVLPIGEARRRLPELVRRVARGGGPVRIGRRGRCEAMLVSAGAEHERTTRRPLGGLAEILGSWDDLIRAEDDIRRDVDASLERTARLIDGREARPRRRRRR